MKNYLLITDLNLNPINYEVLLFPGGEPHVKIEPHYHRSIRIEAYLVNANVFMTLLCLINAFRLINPSIDIYLSIIYFPGGRQDQVRNLGEAHTLQVYASIINSLSLKDIEILVPHSAYTLAHVKGSRAISDDAYVKIFVNTIGGDPLLVSPDKGSRARFLKLTEILKFPVVYGSKIRDSKTGNLSRFDIDADDLDGKDCIIVDDICDGGGTFIGLAKELKERNAGKLYLYTTHGIFSKGTDELYTYFDKIGCYHTFHNTKVDFVGRDLPKTTTSLAKIEVELTHEEPVPKSRIPRRRSPVLHDEEE